MTQGHPGSKVIVSFAVSVVDRHWIRGSDMTTIYTACTKKGAHLGCLKQCMQILL